MINTELHIPLHIQISNILGEQIKEGVYEKKIPSERELMNSFSVSRTTIREAISRQVNAGTLKRIRGKGTFLTNKEPIQEWLPALNSFTETVKKMGMEPGSELLHSGKLAKNNHSIEVFEGDIYKIERLRLANDKPVAIEKHFYPIEVGLNLEKYDLGKEAIYDLLENEIGIKLMEAEQFITTEEVDVRIANYLEIASGTNVLSVERIIFNEIGKPVEFYQGIYKPGMYVFRVNTKRNSN